MSLKKKDRTKTHHKRGMPERPQEMDPNEHWSVDFVPGQTGSGRMKSPVNACIWKWTIRSRVVLLGDFWIKLVCLESILSENRPKFTRKAMNAWTYAKQIVQTYIDPDKPIQNATIESFNGKMWDEYLNQYLFRNLEEVRNIIESRKMITTRLVRIVL